MIRSAFISPCGNFRYTLSRTWNASLPVLVFCLLNPSTADGSYDDATVRKCIGFAQRLGFGGLIIVNISAYRAKNPVDLRRAHWPLGPDNNRYLDHAFTGRTVVLGWGANARHNPVIAERVFQRAKAQADRVCALRLLSDGTPEHPLMLPYSCSLITL